MTILEVVLAVFLLGLLAASVAGALNAANAMDERNRQTLAAYELANRLVLTWLDDKKRMPAETLPLDYGNYQFMWDKQAERVRMRINDRQKSSGASVPQALERFRMITINIYLAEGEGPQPRPGTLMASLTRIYDPAAPRNPESMKNIQDKDTLLELINSLTGGGPE